MLHKVDLNLMFADKTLVCDHSNENYRGAHSCAGTVFIVLSVQGGSKR